MIFRRLRQPSSVFGIFNAVTAAAKRRAEACRIFDMDCRALLSSIFLAVLVLHAQQTPAQLAIIEKLSEGLINAARLDAERAKGAEDRRSWLEAAEDYERIVETVPQTAAPLTYNLLIGNAHLDAARCWTRYRESRKDYSPIEADEKSAAHLHAADDAYRKALDAFPRFSPSAPIPIREPDKVQAQGVFADIKVNQAYLHVLENDLAAAAQDYRSLMQRYPASAGEFRAALTRVEDARRKQEGGLWTRDNQVGLAAFIAGKIPDVGFLLAPVIKFGYSYYQSHETPLPYRTR